MPRQTGRYRITSTLGAGRAFVPYPLPPTDPPLSMDAAAAQHLHADALAALPASGGGAQWCRIPLVPLRFRPQEAVFTSQIEDAGERCPTCSPYERPDRQKAPTMSRVCNYVECPRRMRAGACGSERLQLSVRLCATAPDSSERRPRCGQAARELRPRRTVRRQPAVAQRPLVPRPKMSRTRCRCWSDGGMPSATCPRWCGPASRTCSSRPSTRSWTATAVSDGC